MFDPKFYNSQNHIQNLTENEYYKNLILLRDIVSKSCDEYFHEKAAPRVDLFLIAQSVSSPMGRGFDSLPIPIQLGKKHTYLVDSAQFGMEPLVQKHFKMVYCYLPSFRGEDPDNRHLNQFYHCEAELKGTLDETLVIVDGLVQRIFKDILAAESAQLIKLLPQSLDHLKYLKDMTSFPKITFEEAVSKLEAAGLGKLIEVRPYGRQITSEGEKKIVEIVTKNKSPLWLTHYDRDVVPFYQQPLDSDENKVMNADLIFPSTNGGFGGEIVGAGQRQNTVSGLLESMERQEVKNHEGYKWYLEMRKNPEYQITSGFGLGVERLLAWVQQLDCIADTAIYPVLKNSHSEF